MRKGTNLLRWKKELGSRTQKSVQEIGRTLGADMDIAYTYTKNRHKIGPGLKMRNVRD